MRICLTWTLVFIVMDKESVEHIEIRFSASKKINYLSFTYIKNMLVRINDQQGRGEWVVDLFY